MLHDTGQTGKKQNCWATSSDLGVTTARRHSLIARRVARSIGFSRRTNDQELAQHGVHEALHGGNSSILGDGVHWSKEVGEVEAGILEIKMAEDARQSRGRK